MTDARRGPRVLSIDGGGMLGVMTCVYLGELDRRLDGALRDRFDIIAGTSTGAILAAAIGMGKPIDDVRRLYLDRGRQIFDSSVLDSVRRTLTAGLSKPEYSDAGLEHELEREFSINGKAIEFGELRPLVLITAYDTIARRAWVFKNDRDALSDLPAWELVKGSSSAPTYFPAHGMTIGGQEVSLIDGGVFANNPAACALAEALRINGERHGASCPAPSEFVIASFGNGRHVEPITLSQAREWGAAEWVRPLIGVMMDGDQDTTGYICRSVVGADRFFRFEMPFARGMSKLDDASPDALECLIAAAERYIAEDAQQRELDRLASLL